MKTAHPSTIAEPLRAWRWDNVVRIVRTIVVETQEKKFTTQVAALTYTTVLAVVPFLALVLALGRGFGLEQYIESQLRQHLQVQEGVIDQLMHFANSYLAKTQTDWIIGVSFLFLAFTLISLVNNIEEKINALWGVNTSRSIFTFSLSYLGLVVFLVFAIFLLSGVWLAILRLLNYLPQYELVQASTPVLIFVAKWAVAASIFVMMYKYIPVVRVRWRSTLVPGVIASFLFSLIQEFYVYVQVLLTSYNTVYGSFAVLPLLMVWIYITWSICLGGVVMCQAIQYVHEGATGEPERLSRQTLDTVALLLMRLVGQRFVAGERPYHFDQLCECTQLSATLVRSQLERLEAVHAIHSCEMEEDERVYYRVDTDVHQLTVGELLARLDEVGETLKLEVRVPAWLQMAEWRAELHQNGANSQLVIAEE